MIELEPSRQFGAGRTYSIFQSFGSAMNFSFGSWDYWVGEVRRWDLVNVLGPGREIAHFLCRITRTTVFKCAPWSSDSRFWKFLLWCSHKTDLVSGEIQNIWSTCYLISVLLISAPNSPETLIYIPWFLLGFGVLSPVLSTVDSESIPKPLLFFIK